MNYQPWLVVRSNGDFTVKSKEEKLDSDTVITSCSRMTEAWRKVSELSAKSSLAPTNSQVSLGGYR